MNVIQIEEWEYEEARTRYVGWCRPCGAFTRDNTEPDAENYDCPVCSERNVVGAENALLMGLIEVVE